MSTIYTGDRQPAPAAIETQWAKGTFTLPNGCPIDNPFFHDKVQQKNGNSYKMSLLMQDTYTMEQMAHLNRERIPERFGHAKGTGAYGYWETIGDEISNYSCADMFSSPGKRTDMFTRLSTTANFRGSADTVRDTRGLAFKFYTDEGNLDWVFFHPGAFSFYDPGKIVSNNHITKKCPASGLSDANMYFDFFSHNPEVVNGSMRIHSDAGTPRTYNDVTAYSLNTYTFVKDDDDYSFVRVTLRPHYTVKTPFTIAQATEMAGRDPDYHTRQLFKQIENNNIRAAPLRRRIAELKQVIANHPDQDNSAAEKEINDKEQQIEGFKWPRWDAYAQIVLPEEVEHAKVNIFDPSKVWPADLGRTIHFGRITLNRNPLNAFAEVEQAAFSVANVVPGWDVSPDPILQARMFAYGDTQRHRLGVNCNHLPVNRPKYVWCPTHRDGPNTMFNYEDHPTYIRDVKDCYATPDRNTANGYTNSGDPQKTETKKRNVKKCPRWDATAKFDVLRGLNETNTFEELMKQPWEYYRSLTRGPPEQDYDRDDDYVARSKQHNCTYEQWALVNNYSMRLQAVDKPIREPVFDVFRRMDTEHWDKGQPTADNLGEMIKARTEEIIKNNRELAEDSLDHDELDLPDTGVCPPPDVAPSIRRPYQPKVEDPLAEGGAAKLSHLKN